MSFDEQNRSKTIFTCTKCGDCCKGYGGTYVTENDINRISKYTGIETDRLMADYCVPSGRHRVLAQKSDGYCIFFDQVCMIHPVKPRMCRAWPFIKSVLVDTGNWRIMAGVCPGMRTDVSDETIRSCVTAALSESENNSQ